MCTRIKNLWSDRRHKVMAVLMYQWQLYLRYIRITHKEGSSNTDHWVPEFLIQESGEEPKVAVIPRSQVGAMLPVGQTRGEGGQAAHWSPPCIRSPVHVSTAPESRLG